MADRPKLLFIAPWFLFPADAGGKIRTTDILRGMKDGAFEIDLMSPAPEDFAAHSDDLAAIADHFFSWPQVEQESHYYLRRLGYLFGRLPINVATDQNPVAKELITRTLSNPYDLVVVDFPHTAVLLPDQLPAPAVMFTHNVEAEIFARHAKDADNVLWRTLYRDQWRKMSRFEREVLDRFEAVVAVSERDKAFFETEYGTTSVHDIPTGVDLSRFEHRTPPAVSDDGPPRLVFTGSMNWQANIDAFTYFMDEVWPLIIAQRPDTHLDLVGRKPPQNLIRKAEEKGLNWHFTGFVESIVPYVHQGHAYIIPLRVGGGTRIKVYEAMAMGCPVVSTTIGVEGLPIEDGVHFLNADSAADFAAAVLRLLDERELGANLSRQARDYVEQNFSSARVARAFEDICLGALNQS